MDNNYDNTPKENDGLGQQADGVNTPGHSEEDGIVSQQPAGNQEGPRQYTDPNAGEQPGNSGQYPYTGQNVYNDSQQSGGQYGNYNQNYGQNLNQSYNQNYHQNYNQNQSYGQNANYNYQDNYSYNTGNQYNQMYEPGQDSSPMSMGDWLLTLLAAMIPCVGIVLYFVWAFSKTTNVNRRNFCRAQLIIMGVVLVIYIIFLVLFGSVLFSTGRFYY